MTLGIALLFGFSERLLDSVLDKLTEKATATQDSKPNAPPAKPAASAQGLTVTTDAKLPDGTLGQDYKDVKLEVSGATGSPNWVVQTGAPPDGLRLANDGTITGKPTKQGTFTFKAEVSDQVTKQTREFSIKIG